MNAYKPRRCSARWLDADCPPEILAIIDTKHAPERYDVIYAEPFGTDDSRGPWLGFYCLNEYGVGYHGEMLAHQIAAYRYRMKHRYVTWSSLPDAVKKSVRLDIELSKAESEVWSNT